MTWSRHSRSFERREVSDDEHGLSILEEVATEEIKCTEFDLFQIREKPQSCTLYYVDTSYNVAMHGVISRHEISTARSCWYLLRIPILELGDDHVFITS